jgi:hypothetical protein
MTERSRWTDRKFTFGLPTGWLPNIIERLRGTPYRLREITSHLNEALGSSKSQNAWSIKQHIGHLSDLEELHEGRLDDILEGKKMLRAADMTNARTNSADHNKKSLMLLLMDFSTKRQHFIQRLESFDPLHAETKAIHPRLRSHMRVVDIAFFTAEHDDHHLASIRQIMKENKVI